MVDEQDGSLSRFRAIACKLFQTRPADADDREFRGDKYSIDQYQQKRGQDQGNNGKCDFEHFELSSSLGCGSLRTQFPNIFGVFSNRAVAREPAHARAAASTARCVQSLGLRKARRPALARPDTRRSRPAPNKGLEVTSAPHRAAGSGPAGRARCALTQRIQNPPQLGLTIVEVPRVVISACAAGRPR